MPKSFGLPLVLFSLIVMVVCGCTNQPSSEQLEAWRKDAIAHNFAMNTLREPDIERRNWQLEIQGQTTRQTPTYLSLLELNALATTITRTRDPYNTNNPKQVFNFRGVPVSELLDLFGVAPNVTEVTFVSHDAYRVTVKIADLRRYPITIAMERDREKISRIEGGPLYLIFPYTEFPEIEAKYSDRYWAFYVTNMIVGTEPLQLKVRDCRRSCPKGNRHASRNNTKVLTADTLAKLPQVTINEAVGYRIGWPIGKVKLHGVRVSDALAAAGVMLPTKGAAIVRGKAPIYRDSNYPIRLDAAEIKNCSLMLATHWGDDRKLIPANMGGPLTLALPNSCKATSDDRRWLSFVEELEVSY
jgi:hypothetical protein